MCHDFDDHIRVLTAFAKNSEILNPFDLEKQIAYFH